MKGGLWSSQDRLRAHAEAHPDWHLSSMRTIDSRGAARYKQRLNPLDEGLKEKRWN